MCGICGFSGFEDKKTLSGMMEVLHHRGPDDSGIYFDNSVSLGHNRLSIIDLSEKGRQPLSNEDETIWITFNGEIYNFQDLKKMLKGHIFKSATDTEVIVHLYEESGVDLLKELRGMFAFALYDSVSQKLILARDHIGKKPLYYYIKKGIFIFASEIKSILHAFERLGIEKAVNYKGVCSYLRNQYIPGENTIFEGIFKILPGSFLEYDIKKQVVVKAKFWDFHEEISKLSENESIEELRSIIEESTKKRMIADVPVGAFLSGGIDSSAIVALARQNVTYDLHTFSMGFGDLFSELEYAKIVSDHLNTVHHEIIVEPENVLKDISKIAWHYDEPMGDAAVIANYFLSKEARKYVKVALAGEGADELFGGYSSYSAGLKVYSYYKLPKIFRRALKRIISVTPYSGNPAYNFRRVYLGYLAQDNFEMAHQYAWRITAMNDDEIRWFLNGKCNTYTDDFISPTTMTDPLNKMLALDCKNHLPELYLMKADKGMMANSIEERLPILDKSLIEFAFKIPYNFKIKNGVEKYIWKEAVSELLPAEIIKRKKQGFGVPYAHWISGELKEYTENIIESGYFTNNYFDKDKIINIMRNKGSNRKNMLIWNIFALELWNDTYKILN